MARVREHSSGHLDRLLRSSDGILTLIADGVAESDFIEFKRTIDVRGSRAEDELRADCASLATAGRGFLAIGIEERADGTNRAGRISSIERPADMKRSIEDRLGTGFSPPLSKREVWVVDVPGHGSVVIVRVEGRVGYPVELDTKIAPPRFVVREAGKKRWLTSEEARVRRSEIDARRLRLRHIIAGILPTLFLAALISFIYSQFAAGRRGIVTGNGILEYVVKWDEPGTRWEMNTGGGGASIAFMHDQRVIIESKSISGAIRRISDDEVRILLRFELVSPLEVASVTLAQFRTTNRVIIRVPLLKTVMEARAPKGWTAAGGTISVTLNSSDNVTIHIPSQTLESDTITSDVKSMP